MIFAVAVVAVLLAAQPIKTPKKEGIPKGGGTQVTSQTENTKQANKQSQPELPLTDPPTKPRNSNTEDPNSDVDVQRKIEVFTGGLVVVGLLQSVLMFLQWRIYRRQANEMRRQRHEMRRQRHVMYRQWKEMGKQAELIEGQVLEMGKQTDVLQQSVEAAKTSAKAAKDSADALMNSERAWVMVEIGWDKPAIQNIVIGSSDGVPYSCGNFQLNYVNYGKTPAWVSETYIQFELVEYLPSQPIVAKMKKFSDEPTPLPPDITRSYNSSFFLQCPGLKTRETILVIYGIVKYRDSFSPDRQTTFGYQILDGSRFKRLAGAPKYNEQS